MKKRISKSVRRTGKTRITTIIEEELGLPVTSTPIVTAPAVQLTNHVIFVLDRSTSMSVCLSEATKQLQANFQNLKEEARKTGQRTFVSFYVFGSTVECRFRHRAIETVDTLGSIYVSGMTALIDGVCQAIDEHLGLPDAGDVNTSFLLVCATDGQENQSRRSSQVLKSAMAQLQGTDRWTFAFMAPHDGGRSRQFLVNLGVPSGNIMEWENTVDGARHGFGTVTTAAVSNYYSDRSRGLRSTEKFYDTTDASKITSTDLAKMTDISARFRKWSITKETEIRPFVESHGVPFVVGAGHYLLMKKELLRAGRQVLVRDKSTGRIYGGPQARQLLNLRDGEVHVTPGNHANFDVFFQSTSQNRHLVRGTELLWDKTHTPGQSQETWDKAAADAAAELKKARQAGAESYK